MGGILASLKTTFGSRAGESRGLQIFPRSAAPVDFPARERPPRSGADLARIIEGEIIPRLMLAHLPEEDEPPVASAPLVSPYALQTFVQMSLNSEAHTLTSYVEALIHRGLTLEGAYVDLLFPAARRLGDDWNEDIISFTDVTIGLSRMQQVVRALGRSIPSTDIPAQAPSAYFIPVPGEQHAFGLTIVEDYFRRAGWRTSLDSAATRADALRAVAMERFDVFGLSATSDTPTDAIKVLIAEIRLASRNPSLFVMVGGRLFVEEPGLAEEVGADAGSSTAADALRLADNAIRATAPV